MGPDDRRSERANVILTATIESAGSSTVRVRVSNLSANGALVIGDEIPKRETPIVFHCNGLAIESWVSWVDAGRAGIAFAEAVEPETLTHREGVPHAAIVRDTRQVDFRRPGFRGNQLSDEEQRALDEWKRDRSPPSGEDDPT